MRGQGIILWLLLLFLTFNKTSIGQEMLGTVFSDYSGINSAVINPALLTGSRSYLDINIIGANAFVRNTWAYIPKEDMNIWELLSSDSLIPKYGKYRYNGSYKYYENTNTKYLAQSVRIMGPSAMIQTGEHAFGLSFSVRSVTSANNIPFEFPVFAYEELTYTELQDIVFDDNDFDFASLSWAEISGSWAYDFHRFYKGKLTLGINAKFLMAFGGFYSMNRNANYVVYDSKNIEIFNYDAEFGMALPINYDSDLLAYEEPLFKGYGAGLDIGFVYTRMKNIYPQRGGEKICSKPYEEYLYRIGVSILDIGGVSMNKNAVKHNYENVNGLWMEFDTIGFYNINKVFQDLSTVLYDDPNKSKTDDKISIYLPTSVSVQFEAKLKKDIYLSAMWMQSIRTSQKQLRRPSQLAIVPRYEKNMFTISLPISIIEYKYVRLGAAFRVGPLTIGSERLGILLGISDIDGADIYFSLKFNLKKGKCNTYNKGACFNESYKK